MNKSSRITAFTLIELLITISIIATLCAFLMPVFMSSREKARQTFCAQSMRQLHLSNILYANDNSDNFAAAALDFWQSDRYRWFGERNSLGVFESKNGPLCTYLKDNGKLRLCPSFNSNSGFDLATGGYGYNYIGVGSRVWKMGYVSEAFNGSLKESEIQHISGTIMFADCAIDVGSALVEYGFIEPPPSLTAIIPGGMSLDPSMHFRHNQKCNVIYVDGHSKVLPMTSSCGISGVYADANPIAHHVGWIGPISGKTPYDPD